MQKNPTFDGFGEWSVHNCTVSTSNGVVTVTNASVGIWNGIRQSVKCALGHTYLGMCDLMSEKVRLDNRNMSSVGFVKGDIATDNNTYDTAGAWKTVYQIMQITEVRASETFQIYPFNYTGSEVGDVAYIKNARVFDLTQMFGAGNEPTVEEFRAMFPADYYPYREPMLMSYEPDEVASSSGYAADMSSLVRKYFPDGMKSAGDVHDEIDLERKVAIKRIGSINLGVLPWSYVTGSSGSYFNCAAEIGQKHVDTSRTANCICGLYDARVGGVSYGTHTGIAMFYYADKNQIRIYDSTYSNAEEFIASLNGVMLYYELAEPIETPIDPADLEELAVLNVEAGGTLTFANQHGDDYRVPLPNQETYMIKLGGSVDV